MKITLESELDLKKLVTTHIQKHKTAYTIIALSLIAYVLLTYFHIELRFGQTYLGMGIPTRLYEDGSFGIGSSIGGCLPWAECGNFLMYR